PHHRRRRPAAAEKDRPERVAIRTARRVQAGDGARRVVPASPRDARAAVGARTHDRDPDARQRRQLRQLRIVVQSARGTDGIGSDVYRGTGAVERVADRHDSTRTLRTHSRKGSLMSEPNGELKNIIEAALLAAGQPLTVEKLQALFSEGSSPTRDDIRAALEQLEADYAGRGLELKRIDRAYRVQTREKYATWIGRLVEERPARYSRALL